MKARSALAGDQGRAAAPARVSCPRCGGPVDRIARRGLDRLVSLVVPLRRYRCGSDACAWEGALRASRDASSRYGQDGRRPYL
ncbi:MAG TPA: hypothetical protein VFQ20_07385 [Burkholderiaceae bacterium]|nr:hypothetical protein [Burkholderiaceae bacterium]